MTSTVSFCLHFVCWWRMSLCIRGQKLSLPIFQKPLAFVVTVSNRWQWASLRHISLLPSILYQPPASSDGDTGAWCIIYIHVEEEGAGFTATGPLLIFYLASPEQIVRHNGTQASLLCVKTLLGGDHCHLNQLPPPNQESVVYRMASNVASKTTPGT